MARTEIVPGVHRFASDWVNWYLVEDGDGLVLVDAGFPGDRGSFEEGLGELGRQIGDVRAVVITHAHIDHLGFADHVRRETGAIVYVPRDDADNVSPVRWARSERNPLEYVLRYGSTRGLYLEGLRKMAIRSKVIGDFERYRPDDVLPGGLRAIACPGHTAGHCALLDEPRSVLFAGDAFVTWDPYTDRRGPRIVARAATRDAAEAMRSLPALEETGARVVLTGHGEPWTDGIASAAAEVRRNPVA